MMYVALLRGINVGGTNRVEMSRLKVVFESLGYTHIVTYINSGNVIFWAPTGSVSALTVAIERAILEEFGFSVPVLLRSRDQITQLCRRVPQSWINDRQTMRTDVMFLMRHVDTPQILSQFKLKPDIEQLIYAHGALVWNISREHISRGSMIKIMGTDLYRQITIRNINTVRKLDSLMASIDPTVAPRP